MSPILIKDIFRFDPSDKIISVSSSKQTHDSPMPAAQPPRTANTNRNIGINWILTFSPSSSSTLIPLNPILTLFFLPFLLSKLTRTKRIFPYLS